MAQVFQSPTPPPSAPTPAAETQRLLRLALKGALATTGRTDGHPYVSLVTIAATPDGDPLLLLSTLALHTRNLEADPRASVLLDGTNAAGDPLAGGRATLIGRAERMSRESGKPRFLARHPGAALYADFADFSFFRLAVETAHFIGGFGRIVDVPRRELILDVSGAEALLAAEPEIIAHVNEDHADVLVSYATRLAGMPSGPWRLTGVDPDGLDLVLDGQACRIAFPDRVTTPGDVRRALKQLADEARSRT